jgi:hypothetical protein
MVRMIGSVPEFGWDTSRVAYYTITGMASLASQRVDCRDTGMSSHTNTTLILITFHLHEYLSR